MPDPAAGLQSQLRNIETTYGRSVDELVALVADSGLTKHPDIVAMLKKRLGMTHGAAHRISIVARERLGTAQASVKTPAPIEVAILYEELVSAARALGDDVEEAPKKGYVSLRRRKQFAMLQPGARCVDVGLVLRNVKAAGRLEPAQGWNALFTHRVRVATRTEINAELIRWLGIAYEQSG